MGTRTVVESSMQVAICSHIQGDQLGKRIGIRLEEVVTCMCILVSCDRGRRRKKVDVGMFSHLVLSHCQMHSHSHNWSETKINIHMEPHLDARLGTSCTVNLVRKLQETRK